MKVHFKTLNGCVLEIYLYLTLALWYIWGTVKSGENRKEWRRYKETNTKVQIRVSESTKNEKKKQQRRAKENKSTTSNQWKKSKKILGRTTPVHFYNHVQLVPLLVAHYLCYVFVIKCHIKLISDICTIGFQNECKRKVKMNCCPCLACGLKYVLYVIYIQKKKQSAMLRKRDEKEQKEPEKNRMKKENNNAANALYFKKKVLLIRCRYVFSTSTKDDNE